MPEIYYTPQGRRRPALVAVGLALLAGAVVALIFIGRFKAGSGAVIGLGFGGTAGVWAGAVLLVMGLMREKPDVRNAFAIGPNGALYHLYADVGEPTALPVGLVGKARYNRQLGQMAEEQETARQQMTGEEFAAYVQGVIEDPTRFNGVFYVTAMHGAAVMKSGRKEDVVWYTTGRHRMIRAAVLNHRCTGYDRVLAAVAAAPAGVDYTGRRPGDSFDD